MLKYKALAMLLLLCFSCWLMFSFASCTENPTPDDPWVRVYVWKNCLTHGFASKDSGWVNGNPASTSAWIACYGLVPPHAAASFQYVWALKTTSGKTITPTGYAKAVGIGCSAGKSYWVQGFPEEVIEVCFSRGIVLNQTLNSFANIELKVLDLTNDVILYYANASVSPEGFKVFGPPEWENSWTYESIEAVTGIKAQFEPKNITISVPEGNVIEVFCNATATANEDGAISAVQVDQEWVPYIPPEENVELKHWVSNGISYVNVSITFPHLMFNVSSWGDPIMIGNSISVDSEIWQYTGPTMPVIYIVQHTYELGTLFPGEYNFTFMAWGQTVKSITFKIKRDIAITNVWPKKNIVPQGMTFDPPRKTLGLIIVNVTNQGDFPEVFNLTVFEGVEPAPILIERWPDPDGRLSDEFWKLGDVNRDGYIDYYDVCLVLKDFGRIVPLGHPTDLNGDGKITFWDLMIVNQHFNLTIWERFHLPKVFQDYAVVSLNTTYYEFIGFRWNTTETSFGNYTFSAYAWPVPDEEDIENNAFKDCWIYVAGKGDINVDEIVDIYDIVLVAVAFDSDSSQPNWNPNADINDDCKVDIFDIVIVALNFDETYQYP